MCMCMRTREREILYGGTHARKGSLRVRASRRLESTPPPSPPLGCIASGFGGTATLHSAPTHAAREISQFCIPTRFYICLSSLLLSISKKNFFRKCVRNVI